MDEKGYLSRPSNQKTFILELFYESPRKVNQGWFYDKNKTTTHYLLCWPERENINIYKERLELEHIHSVEFMLVNRYTLQLYLDKEHKINAISAEKKYNSLGSGETTIIKDSDIKYHYSNQLFEKPLNLVLTKQKYLASGSVIAHYKVSREGIIKL